jgi:hypothetical protein
MDIEEYSRYTAPRTNSVLDTMRARDQASGELDAPIIILQGDHGPGAYMSYSKPLTSNMRERMSILNAYLVPAEATRRLYPSITPVNSFRVLLDVLLGESRPLLPDESYFTLDDTRLYNMIDVTERARSDSMPECGSPRVGLLSRRCQPRPGGLCRCTGTDREQVARAPRLRIVSVRPPRRRRSWRRLGGERLSPPRGA